MIKLVDKEELRKEREEKLALEEKKAGGQGRWFEPGWKQTYFSSFVSLPFVADVYEMTHIEEVGSYGVMVSTLD